MEKSTRKENFNLKDYIRASQIVSLIKKENLACNAKILEAYIDEKNICIFTAGYGDHCYETYKYNRYGSLIIGEKLVKKEKEDYSTKFLIKLIAKDLDGNNIFYVLLNDQEEHAYQICIAPESGVELYKLEYVGLNNLTLISEADANKLRLTRIKEQSKS